MTTIKQVAEAFVLGKQASCHNAKTDGKYYRLHGNEIAYRAKNGIIVANWCSWYTPTTANHLNKIAAAIGSNTLVSYAEARDNEITEFIYDNQNF